MNRDEKIDQMVDEAMIFERMWCRMNGIIENLSSEKNQHIRDAKAAGEKIDKSYERLIGILCELRADLKQEADDAWAEVDAMAEKHETGYEALANAVLELAALDYEAALCGTGSESHKYLIEKFANCGAEIYTHLDFTKVLERIQRAHKEFVKLVHDRGNDIITYTNSVRSHRGSAKRNRVKCPLCGNTLYASGNPVNNLQMIRCVGCNLSEYFYIKDDADT